MPTQEDRVLARMKQVSAYIRDSKNGVEPDQVDDWAYVTLGIRPKTTQMYVKALLSIGSLSYDKKTGNLHSNLEK